MELSKETSGAEPKRAARVVLMARASYGDGAISTACTVNELSETSARLSIASSFGLPEIFQLDIPVRGISRRARVAWRKDDQAGVEFVVGEAAGAANAPSDAAAKVKMLETDNAKLRAQIAALTAQVQRLTEDLTRDAQRQSALAAVRITSQKRRNR